MHPFLARFQPRKGKKGNSHTPYMGYSAWSSEQQKSGEYSEKQRTIKSLPNGCDQHISPSLSH
ncbi:hypothetical protein Pan181_25680 [Aeoliella mucimassa]|uniref:Uncharacterized protein n=1 Tax=Aeoliella mucimassa TaxID=2527972 RepID=A0A518ANR0_9BACT|nr:hypothetical protein Pan181_25680 [Aeoliella mucimassa]